jgi:hypothetical protein
MARRPLPRAGLPHPRGGRRGGRRGVAGTAHPGSPAEAFLETACGGRTHARRIALSNQNPGPGCPGVARAAQEDFFGKFLRQLLFPLPYVTVSTMQGF